MIKGSPSISSHSTRTSVCSDDHLNGQSHNRPSLYRQLSNDSLDPNTMAVSRMSSLSTYGGSPSLAPPEAASQQPPLQIDDSAIYPDSVSHDLSSEAGILTTRGGKTFQFPSGLGIRNIPTTDKVRVLKAPRVRRRPKTAKADKSANLVITAPLSQLTQHMHHIPIKDMEAWVNRPIETRRKEVALKNGKIARPMNSFMLYRSAYAERTKQWCSQNNHQVVSRVSGQSWPKEPADVREKYELLSVIERENHQKAHPEYKFAPNKTQTPPRKKRTLEDGESETDEAGYQIPPNASPVPHKIIKASNSAYNSRESSPYDHQDSVLQETYNPHPWSASVSHHIPPRLMATEQQQHGYYMSPHASLPNLIRTSDDTHPAARQGGFAVNGTFSASTGLAGIPGSINQELLQSYGSGNGNSNSGDSPANTARNNNSNSHGNGHVATRMEDRHLDPQLLSSHQAGMDMRPYNNVALSTLWHANHQDMGPYMPMNGSMGNHGIAYNSLHHPSYGSIQQLEEGQNVWAQAEDDGIAVPEVGKDFDQWIHSQNPHAVYGSQ